MERKHSNTAAAAWMHDPKNDRTKQPSDTSWAAAVGVGGGCPKLLTSITASLGPSQQI